MSGSMSYRFGRVFNKKGNFNLKEFELNHFDPYRKDENNQNFMDLWNLVFDDSGSVQTPFFDYLEKVVGQGNLSPTSDAVKLYYAHIHGRNTSGYPAVYMWR